MTESDSSHRQNGKSDSYNVRADRTRSDGKTVHVGTDTDSNGAWIATDTVVPAHQVR